MTARTTDFDSGAAASAAAMRLISHRDHSRLELRRKLEKRGYSSVAIDAAIDQLQKLDLVCDRRFAASYARMRAGRLFGPLRIRAELRGRGIDDADIGHALQCFDDQWIDNALRWVEKRASAELDLKTKARLYRSLTNRGFSHQHAMQALNSFCPTS